MTAQELLAEVHARGLELAAGPDGRPRLRGDRAKATPALLRMLARHRNELLALARPQGRQWRWVTQGGIIPATHLYRETPADAWLWGHTDRHPAGAWWWRYADCDEWLPVPGTPADPDCGELPPLEAPARTALHEEES